MNIQPGNILLYSNFLLLLISFIFFKKEYLKWIIRSAFLSMALAFFLLIYYFLVSDFSIAYVFSFSSTDLPLMYKISAVLTGQSGTFLFWGLMINLQALWLAGRLEVHKIDEILKIVLVMGLVFGSLTILQSPFNSFSSVYADEIKKIGFQPDYVPEEGQGLNLALQDPWMAIHPPLTFMGYGFLAIPFAAAIVYLMRGFNFSEISGQWAKLSWLFLTLAIATGGYWTYKVFAGADYWAWDPVETSSLLPWLTLTAYLHVANKHQEFRIFAPSLIIFSFILSIYATFITRSGFWPSVHAFAGTSSNIILLIFLILLTISSSALILIKLARMEKSNHEMKIFTSRSLNYYTVTLLSIVVFIILFGITYPALLHVITGNQAVMEKDFFNLWTFPFVFGLVIVMGICYIFAIFPEYLLKKFTAYVLITSIFLAIIGLKYPLIKESLFSTAQSMLGRIVIQSYIPIFIFSLLAIFYVSYKDIKLNVSKNMATHIIHLGVILILLGIIMSTSFDTRYNVKFSVAETGKMKDAGGGYAIQLNDLKTAPVGLNFVQSASLSVFKDGILIANGTSSYISVPIGGGNLYAMIQHGVFSDVYAVFHSPYAEQSADYFTVPITLRILPFVNFIWLGVILFCIGMGIRILT